MIIFSAVTTGWCKVCIAHRPQTNLDLKIEITFTAAKDDKKCDNMN